MTATRAPTRTERDSFGPIEVPATALWGAQTARSLRFFAIGDQPMPLEVIHALARIKWAAACVNRDLGLLDAAPVEHPGMVERAAMTRDPALQELLDKQAIAEVIARYSRTLDWLEIGRASCRERVSVLV